MTKSYFKKLIQRRVSKTHFGQIRLLDSSSDRGAVAPSLRGYSPFDREDSPFAADWGSVDLLVHDPVFYRAVALGGALGVAESYLRGQWDCPDLTRLFRIMIRNMEVTDQLDKSLLTWVRRAGAAVQNWLNRNTPRGSRRNIASHYDLGNEFYKLWLDETMTYSSGIFESPDATMEQASAAKLERACRLLQLGPQDHLLEIGSGWGSLAAFAARRFGCRVTTTTISDEQFDYTRQLVQQLGLQDRVRVLKKDYRDLSGNYDKLASIEMIEAVGHPYLPTFFEKCSQLLKPGGEMMLQSIVIADDRFRHHQRTVDFISYYIFPGGALPSRARLAQVAAESGRLNLLQLDALGPHYAETLRRWRREFFRKLPQIRDQGFDERFVRMWHYYLCYCEAAFDERQVDCVQLLFRKRGHGSATDSSTSRWVQPITSIPSVNFRDSRPGQVVPPPRSGASSLTANTGNVIETPIPGGMS